LLEDKGESSVELKAILKELKRYGSLLAENPKNPKCQGDDKGIYRRHPGRWCHWARGPFRPAETIPQNNGGGNLPHFIAE
jgi:hypothetical protein